MFLLANIAMKEIFCNRSQLHWVLKSSMQLHPYNQWNHPHLCIDNYDTPKHVPY